LLVRVCQFDLAANSQDFVCIQNDDLCFCSQILDFILLGKRETQSNLTTSTLGLFDRKIINNMAKLRRDFKRYLTNVQNCKARSISFGAKAWPNIKEQ
jgi:hypothetical protein